MKFFLFYSNKCRYCSNIIDLINSDNLSNECQMICFEDEPSKIPSIITDVPTIVAPNLTQPLVGIDALKWIENKKYYDQITNNINKINVINPKIESAIDYLAFNKKETVSISDSYTNIEDIDIEKNQLDFTKISLNAPITNNVENIKIVDTKIDKTIQEIKLRELINMRKLQMIHKYSNTMQINK